MITEEMKVEIHVLLEEKLGIDAEVEEVSPIFGLPNSYRVAVNHRTFIIDLASWWAQEEK